MSDVNRPKAIVKKVDSERELERSIVAAMANGSPGVKGTKNGVSTWYLSRGTVQSILTLRNKKSKHHLMSRDRP